MWDGKTQRDQKLSFDREQIRQRVAGLAAQGVFLGTSSWKYEGWRGLLYDESRYVYRGKFAASRFEKNCLAEYAEVFKTVCVDAAFYKFPDEKYLTGLVSQVPEDFAFAFKVTDEVTIKKFPQPPPPRSPRRPDQRTFPGRVLVPPRVYQTLRGVPKANRPAYV